MNQFDLLKSHIEAFTRKDGSVVAAHDDKRQAAQPEPAASMSAEAVQSHAVASGAKHKSSVQVFSQKSNATSFANRAMNSKGSAFVMKHPDHAHHVVVGGADAQRMQKNGYHFADDVGQAAPPAEKKPEASTHKFQVRDPSGNVHKVFHGPNAEYEARQHISKNQSKRLSLRNVTPE